MAEAIMSFCGAPKSGNGSRFHGENLYNEVISKLFFVAKGSDLERMQGRTTTAYLA